MTATEGLVSALHESRQQFLALVAGLRPDLHRYCARMTGSAIDGEDIVQDTLVRAYFALAELEALPPLQPWLFQIAHNRAIDFLRGYDRRMSEPLDGIVEDLPSPDTEAADDALARDEAVLVAVTRFMELVPLQRSCVVLKDVLGHSVDEISELLTSSVPAVKAALHRGRARLRKLASEEPREQAAPRHASPTIVRYAALFNARDWDGVRALLAEDVQLDVVSREQRAGRVGVGNYFSNYDGLRGWRLVPAWLDGREVLALFRREEDPHPRHVVEVTVVAGSVTKIRDYWHVDYLLQDGRPRIVSDPSIVL